MDSFKFSGFVILYGSFKGIILFFNLGNIRDYWLNFVGSFKNFGWLFSFEKFDSLWSKFVSIFFEMRVLSFFFGSFKEGFFFDGWVWKRGLRCVLIEFNLFIDFCGFLIEKLVVFFRRRKVFGVI